jgi:hypothetical protein
MVIKRIIDENLTKATLVDRESYDTIKAWFDEAYHSEADAKALRGFVCAFSQNGDQLSQWRAYCTSGNGVSIGFNTAVLKQIADEGGFQLEQCIYNENKQEKLLRKPLQKIISATYKNLTQDNKLKNDHHLQDVELGMWWDFANVKEIEGLILKFKDPSFVEEQEYRLVSYYDAKRPLKFRVSRSLLIPYICLEIPERLIPDLLAQVFIGPTPHPELNEMAVREYLRSIGISRPKNVAKKSVVPYRSW